MVDLITANLYKELVQASPSGIVPLISQIEGTSPFDNVSPMVKDGGHLSLPEFYTLLYHTIDIENPDIIIAPAYPEYLIPNTPEYVATEANPTLEWKDTITYMVTRMQPGNRGGSKTPFTEPRELTPQYREELIKNDGQTRMSFGQIFDVLIQFDIWTRTNYQAEQLVEWFRQFMTLHRSFFKKQGLSEILFWWRGIDEISSKLRTNIHLRSLAYYIRFEDLLIEDVNILKDFTFKMSSRYI